MSVVRKGRFMCEWGYLTVIPWYRQVIALVFGLGVVTIALWAIQQGEGRLMIVGVVGMAFLSLLLIFGIEIDRIEIGDKFVIDFSNTDSRTTLKDNE